MAFIDKIIVDAYIASAGGRVLQKLGTLADLGPMETGMIIAVNDMFCDWEYEDQFGGISRLRPGAMVRMVAKLPAEGPMMVVVDGEEYNIFPDMASSIFVKKVL